MLNNKSYQKNRLELLKFGNRATITPQLYSQSMKHFVTRLNDKCWFSKQPHITPLTVEEAISKYPSYMKWCFLNLRVRWSCKTRKILFNISK